MQKPGSDELRRLSDELAREPGSLAFLPLAERLLAADDLDAAERVALGGVRRHPHNVDAHALLGRLAEHRGDWDGAVDAWERVVTLSPSPSHMAAHARQVQAFIRFQEGRYVDAESLLDAAASAGGDPGAISAARAHVRRRLGDVHGRALFDALLEPGDRTALLVDADGAVAAGHCVDAMGRDVSAAVAAELAGVGDEATRAMRHLALGEWRSVVVEASDAVIALAPAGDGIVLVAIDSSTPLGRLRRLLDRVGERARAWRRAS